MDSYALQTKPRVAHAKPPGPIKKERRERLKDGKNNGQLRIANPTSGGARKAAWANKDKYKVTHQLSKYKFTFPTQD